MNTTNYFTLPTNFFLLDLTKKEKVVYAYLLSIYARNETEKEKTIHVRQGTIAASVGIKATQTVSKIIDNLIKKGYIISATRKKNCRNGTLGTYTYAIKKPSLEDGFFSTQRDIFAVSLSTNQILLYLFISKAHSVDIGFSWNSYSDLSRALGIKRSTVIALVRELVELKLIYRQTAKARNCNRQYVDNHYFIIRRMRGTISKKMQKRKSAKPNEEVKAKHSSIKSLFNNTTKSCRCQEIIAIFDEKYEVDDYIITNCSERTQIFEPRPRTSTHSHRKLESQKQALLGLFGYACWEQIQLIFFE